MGLFWKSPSDGQDPVKVKDYHGDKTKITADKYTPTEGGGHAHSSYNLNTTSGEYKQYGGGENSDDRSYNK